jgi:nitrite reductase/ring-hydroxylating ferredoxin subunit
MNDREPGSLSAAPDGLANAEQPRWRRDFPIDWPEDEYIARRDFTKFMVLTSFAFAVGQLWILVGNIFRRREAKLPAKAIARVEDIPVGASRVFDYPQAHQPGVLVRLDDRRFVAYDQKCTHLSCPVIPRVKEGRLHCPCHEGIFDLATGRPLAGPPQRPLARINLEIRQGRIYAVGVEERTV